MYEKENTKASRISELPSSLIELAGKSPRGAFRQKNIPHKRVARDGYMLNAYCFIIFFVATTCPSATNV